MRCALILFFLMIRRPPRSTLFPTRRSSDLSGRGRGRGPSRRAGEGRRGRRDRNREEDRKSTRLNSSHSQISYAVFCLKKKIELGVVVVARLIEVAREPVHIETSDVGPVGCD